MRLSRQDIKLAARSLRRQRGFAIVAILSLALAIALNTTMFSVLDAMINPRLDMREPNQLYRLTVRTIGRADVDDATRASLISAGFKTYEEVTYHDQNFLQQGAVEFGHRYAQVRSATVAPNFFSMLGSRPVAGRLFVSEDYTDGSGPVVISERLAATLSPDKPFPVGEVVDVDRRPYTSSESFARRPLPPDFDGEDLWRLPAPTTAAAVASDQSPARSLECDARAGAV